MLWKFVNQDEKKRKKYSAAFVMSCCLFLFPPSTKTSISISFHNKKNVGFRCDFSTKPFSSVSLSSHVIYVFARKFSSPWKKRKKDDRQRKAEEKQTEIVYDWKENSFSLYGLLSVVEGLLYCQTNSKLLHICSTSLWSQILTVNKENSKHEIFLSFCRLPINIKKLIKIVAIESISL